MEPLAAEFSCAACHTPFVNRFPLDEQGLCSLCRQGHLLYDGAFAYGAYDGPLRRLIHLFKFDRVRTLAGPLGRLMSRALPEGKTFDVVVPTPLHWRRQWRRGFNQSHLLAQEVARRIGVPVVGALRRTRHTDSQSGLTSAGRRRNIAGAFDVPARRANAVRGRRVLLIDDVLTTGASAGACARALKRAGASEVVVLTVARADRRAPAVSLREVFSAATEEVVA